MERMEVRLINTTFQGLQHAGNEYLGKLETFCDRINSMLLGRGGKETVRIRISTFLKAFLLELGVLCKLHLFLISVYVYLLLVTVRRSLKQCLN